VAAALSEHYRKLPSLGPFLSGPGDLGYFSARYKPLKSLKNFSLRAGQVGDFGGAASGTEKQTVDRNVRSNTFSSGNAIKDRKSFKKFKVV
jgi:hypothetical protein